MEQKERSYDLAGVAIETEWAWVWVWRIFMYLKSHCVELEYPNSLL